MIQFKPNFNEAKATGLATYLLELANGSLNYMKLIKLMYLVDRASFCEIGQFVTNDDMYALPNGPLLSNVDDLLTQPSRSKTVWAKHISSPKNYTVCLLGKNHKSVQNLLSDYELELAKNTFNQFKKMDVWKMVDYLHTNLPEWENPGKGRRKPIDLSVILASAGKSPAECSEILSYLATQAKTERFFQ